MTAKGQRATLALVAASAGVSVATVSRVLNGHSDVGADTRARVESLLRQHEYSGRRTGPVRQSPATARVELVLATPLSSYTNEVMQGVIEAGGEAGIAVAVGVDDRQRPERDSSRGWARDLVGAGRRAVITVVHDLTAEDLAELDRVGLPVVVVDPKAVPQANVTSVGSTNFAGGLAAAQHLLSLGHRRIAYLGGDSTAANQPRMHGYRAGLEGQGIKIPEAYVRVGRFLYEDGVTSGGAMLDLPEPPTAIFAGSDETAAGVIEAARVRGLRVPEDLSVVGFDDTRMARFLSPPMTTVRQPLREMGAVALRTALRLAANEKLDSYHVELATQLIVRHSTAPPAC